MIFTSAETVELVMSKYSRDWRRKVRVLPHAFDSSLFSDVAVRRTEGIVVRYVGNFYGLRTPDPLITAIKTLIQQGGSVLDNVTFELIGALDLPTTEVQQLWQLPERLVRLRVPVDYEESLALMTESDGLLIIDAPSPFSVFLPSKLIDYIGAGRPIMGFTPPGAAARVIHQLGGWVAAPGDPASAAKTLKEFLDYVRQRKEDSGVWGNPRVRLLYEARGVAKAFDSIIREVL